MKKINSFLTILLVLISLCSCKIEKVQENIVVTTTTSTSTTVMNTTVCTTEITTNAVYVKSRNSNKFHYSECKWVSHILDENLENYDNREELIEKGYKPCEDCRP